MQRQPLRHDETPRTARIAVVGGGISGLAAALHLAEQGRGCKVALFEASARLGGALWTIHEQGFQIEQGVDNFITAVPWGVELCRHLGLAGELVQTDPRFRQTFVVRKGQLYKLPEGFLMMAPTRFWPLVTTRLLSPWGKLRCAWEYFLPPRRDEEDESMAAFVRRRLGREAYERLVEPLVAAVYAADLEKLSVHATLLRLRQMEREHRSLIRAMRCQMKQRRSRAGESGPRFSMFVTLRQGLGSLVAAIAQRLPAGTLRLETAVRSIAAAERGWRVFFDQPALCPPADSGRSAAPSVPDNSAAAEGRIVGRIDLPAFAPLAPGNPAAAAAQLPAPPGQGSELFDAVILATPSHEAARLLAPADAELARLLAAIEHSSTVVVSLAYDQRHIDHPLDGMGIVVPAVERSVLLALSMSSRKYAHRAPEGKLLLRVFAGGPRWPEAVAVDDRILLGRVLDEVAALLGIRAAPEYLRIARWPRSMPQYHVGHRALVARIEQRVAALAGLELAGNAYHGVGVPHCIHSGQMAAQRVREYLGG